MATKKVTTRTTRKTTRKGNKVTRVTTTVEEVVQVAQLTNHVIFLLDDSGSMSNCYRKAVEELNRNIRTVKENALKSGQRTTVSLYLFGGGGTVTCRYFQQSIDRLQELDAYDFAHGGSTPLRDAICTAITNANQRPDSKDSNTSYLLICATDGGENSSRAYTPAMLETMVKQAQASDRWTLAFMVPRNMSYTMTRMGIPADNVIEWDNTSAGAEIAFLRNNVSVNNYYTMRSQGLKSTDKFYVETDLSKLTKADLTKLDDISARFKATEVTKEADIKAFAEEKTGKPYVIGSIYYALTKKEKVQAQKDVLLMEKGKKAIWGGAQARGLLGLPVGQEATVTPGNHAGYDVYVKSTSVNRKLVRGTKILIDKLKTQDDVSTWDHVTAKAVADAKKAAAEAAGQSST